MTIDKWIKQATAELAKGSIKTAKLDAELILSHTLRRPKTFLHAHSDEPIPVHRQEIADSRLRLRLDRVPVAYIIGHKEFYGRRFQVTPAVLIPRPESETIIEVLKEILPSSTALLKGILRLVDVGTGSGNLGITAKLEFPELNVTLIDLSRHALNVARSNAKALNADVTILKSNLLAEYVFTPDIIIANLPYVDVSWERSPETDHEPDMALFSHDGGLALIKNLIIETSERLPLNGTLILEADPEQHSKIISYAKKLNLFEVKSVDYCVVLRKN